MNNKKPVSPAGKPVLRDVVMQPQAHTLARSKSLPDQKLSLAVSPASGDGATLVSETDARESIFAKAFAEGLAAGTAAGQEKGYKDGYQGGHAQGLKEGKEAGRLDGYKEGCAQGLDKGRQAAEEAIKAEVERRCIQLDQLMAQLPAQVVQRLSAAEDDMVALCFTAICRVVGETMASEEGLRQFIRHQVEQMRTNQLIAIHVHPEDFALLESDPTIAHMLRRHQADTALRWVADNTVALGGGILRSYEGSLDVRLETQMTALRDILLAVRKSRNAVQAIDDQPNLAHTASQDPV